MTAPRLAAAGLAATLLAGCVATSASPHIGRAPAIRQIELRALPAPPAHDDPQPIEIDDRPDPTDPQQVAIAQIVAGLAAQDLEVVDVGVATIGTGTDRRTFAIAVSHRTRDSTWHTSVYEVVLARDDDGSWAVRSAEAVQ